ncbi:MAG: hypothetical protein CME38_06440 [Haliea sp.]|nr:hypothetical protein [Haliea sp.]|tara:strand:- start:3952 stop:4641 length:690 start_codon:yes stop_codon:yes gene_type:complete
MDVLWIYLFLTLVVAAWLGIMMWRHLDKFDWRLRAEDIWFGFVVCLLLWPVILVIKPSLILSGWALREGETGVPQSLARRVRTLHQIADTPSNCGAIVIYRSYSCLLPGRDHLDIRFKSADIVHHFRGRELPLHVDGEQAALVHFIKNRDESKKDPVEIPHAIDFGNMATELLENGYGEVDCPICRSTHTVDELKIDSPPLHVGWNADTYSCPQGHELMRRRTIHLYMR